MKTEYNYEDQSLLLAIKNGNEKAFDTLFRKYYPMLCAYENKFVELEDAEECVQDAMLWLWENKDMLVIQSSLSNYLFSNFLNLLSITSNKSTKCIATFNSLLAHIHVSCA